MVNIRNLQVFGWRAYRPEKRHMLIAFLVVCAVVIGSLWILSPGKQNASAVTTGAAIAPSLEESQEQIQSTEESTNEELPPPEVPLEEQTVPEEEKEFYEYGGSCASDVKDAQDDVNDVTTYLSQYQQEQTTLHTEYDAVKTEYETKLAELKAFYESKIKEYENNIMNKDADVTEAEQELQYAQQHLQETTTRCEPTP